MRMIVMGMVFSLVPTWVAMAADEQDNGARRADHMVFVSDDGQVQAVGSARATAVVELKDGSPHVVTTVRVEGDGINDGRSEDVSVRRVERIAVAKHGGWLGVSIGNVPDEVQAQIGDVQGVYIRNVVKDSPADQAGIQAHDIILAVDGVDVGADIGRAIDLVKAHQPGENVEVVALRAGEEVPMTVTLASRADHGAHAFSWKFDIGPETDVEESVQTHGKMMFRGPGGRWVFKDLGDLADLADLPEDIRMMLPQDGSRTFQFVGQGDEKSISVSVELKDGETIAVERKDGGDITVSRGDARGNETETVYATEADLETADPEAFNLYKQAGERVVVHLDLDGLTDLHDMHFNVDTTSEDLQQHVAEWQSELHEALEAARESYDGSVEQVHELLQRLHEGEALKGLPNVFRFGGDGADGKLQRFDFRFGKPRHTFEVRPDGTIEVKIRKGDSELVQLYTDENDLADRNPALYGKYEELMSAGQDQE